MLQFADILAGGGDAANALRDALWTSMYGPTGPAGVTGTMFALGGHMQSNPYDAPTSAFVGGVAVAGATAASWQQQLLLAASPRGNVQWNWISTVQAALGVTGYGAEQEDG